MGFGLEKEQDDGGTIQQTLRDVTVPYVTNDVCNQLYGRGRIKPEMLCAGKYNVYVTMRYVTLRYFTSLYGCIIVCVFSQFLVLFLLCVCACVYMSSSLHT
jgi:hypothetical protein